MKNHLLAPIAFVLGAIVPLFSEAGPAKPAFSVPTDFQINSAMWSLFGNFDRKTKSSQFEIPQDTELDLKGSAFTIGDAIVVMPLWASIAVENRKHKVVLLTYAVPKSSYGHAEADPNNFECHACAPLIGVAIFVYKDHRWQIESLRT